MRKVVFMTGILAAVSILFSGCTSTEQGAAGGAVAGGALGAIIGHQSGETGAGAAIGAAGGALVGAAIGHSQENSSSSGSEHHVQLCPQGHEVDVTGFGPGAQVRCPIDNSTFTVQ